MACHVYDVGVGQPEQHQQAEHPLLVVANTPDLAQLDGVEAEAGDNNDGAGHLVVGKDGPIHRGQPILDRRKRGQLLG